MKKRIQRYFTETVTPAYTLGVLTSMAQNIFGAWNGTETVYDMTSFSRLVGPFLIFLMVMTCDDIYTYIRSKMAEKSTVVN